MPRTGPEGGRPLVLATRGSPLARWQAARVADLLRASGHASVELLTVTTTGDRLAHVSLAEIGGQGVFAKEVQTAVLDGRADAAVHSAKDLPALTPPGLVLAAVPERADPRDALAGASLASLPAGAVVGTSSPRRRAQLAWWRPDLRFAEVRGNIDRRLRRPGGLAAVVVAAAALVRLDRLGDAAELLPTDVLLPQVGQGAIAVECRADDAATRAALAAVDDGRARRAVEAERAFLQAVGGGCRAAVGALARDAGDGGLVMDALLAAGDGHVVVRARVAGDDPAALGAAARHELLARGAGTVLDAIGLGDASSAGGERG